MGSEKLDALKYCKSTLNKSNSATNPTAIMKIVFEINFL
jgi:hypothetical protein